MADKPLKDLAESITALEKRAATGSGSLRNYIKDLAVVSIEAKKAGKAGKKEVAEKIKGNKQITSSLNKLIEDTNTAGKLIETMSQTELEVYYAELQAAQKSLAFTSESEENKFNAFKSRVYLEMELARAQNNQLEAEEKGFAGAMAAHFHKMNINVMKFMKRTFGISLAGTKAGMKVAKSLTVLTIIAIAFGAVIDATLGKLKAAEPLLKYGLPAGAGKLTSSLAAIDASLVKNTLLTFTRSDAERIFGDAMQYGAYSMSMNIEAQKRLAAGIPLTEEFYSGLIDNVFNLQKTMYAVYGTADVSKQVYQLAKGFDFLNDLRSKNLEKFLIYMKSYSVRLGVSSTMFLDTMSIIAESVEMAGADLGESSGLMLAFADSAGKLKGIKAYEIEKMFGVLNNSLKEFGVMQRVAVTAAYGRKPGETMPELIRRTLSEGPLVGIFKLLGTYMKSPAFAKMKPEDAATMMAMQMFPGMELSPATIKTIQTMIGTYKSLGPKAFEGLSDADLRVKMEKAGVSPADYEKFGATVAAAQIPAEERIADTLSKLFRLVFDMFFWVMRIGKAKDKEIDAAQSKYKIDEIDGKNGPAEAGGSKFF